MVDRASEWRKQNPERAREIAKRSYDKRKREGKTALSVTSRTLRRIERPEQALFSSAKSRAEKNSIPFSITLDDIEIPEVCPVLGVPIVIHPFRHPHGPSIDRLIPDLGYVKGNIKVISMKANRLKSNGLLHEFKALVSYLENNT